MVGGLAIHHQGAIDHVKLMIEEDGDDQKDFDYLSFNYMKATLLSTCFTAPNLLKYGPKQT